MKLMAMVFSTPAAAATGVDAAGASAALIEMRVEVRGTYPAVKSWLSELTDRFDSLVVVGLDLRTGESAAVGPGATAHTQGEVRLRWMAPTTAAQGVR